MLPNFSKRYCNFECFASSEIWHILHQRLYWQRFKHSWILGTTNSFSQYNSISEFGTRLFPFFHIPTVRYFEWCLWRCPRPEWTGAAFFQPWCRLGCGFFVGCLPNGTPELSSNFQRYFLLADFNFSGFLGSWVEVVEPAKKILKITHNKRWFSQQTSMIYRGSCIPSAKV